MNVPDMKDDEAVVEWMSQRLGAVPNVSALRALCRAVAAKHYDAVSRLSEGAEEWYDVWWEALETILGPAPKGETL